MTVVSNPRHHHPGSAFQVVGMVRKNAIGNGLQFRVSGGPREGTYFIRPKDIEELFHEGIPVPVLAFEGEPFEGEPWGVADCAKSYGGNMFMVKFRFEPKSTNPIPKERRAVEVMFPLYHTRAHYEREDPVPIELLAPLDIVRRWARAEGKWVNGRVVA